ncbi:snare-like protein [Microstroma glucosiphilum]|uniref:Protein transport protein SEC22 n=1 Tax=Pseudomicrostroma glucosiphilum TaxID=1684307 RepID=A0A316UBF3_9BASI|nr:snare-like protein [Pseudomicrostroma glucosiphilum]PWN22557.1 snare-like protein [Pseudomicrostroma glucosiphilum]
MVLSTQILRLSDQLPLAQSVDDDQSDRELGEVKQQSKTVVKKLNSQSENRCSIESGKYTLHYLLHPPPPQPTPTSCVYLTIAPKSYPRKLAFAFLDELAREFEQSYGSQVGQRSLRPYAFVGFDTFLQKTKRVYLDSRSAESSSSAAAAAASSNPTSSNLDRLNNDLQDVTRIMTKNMEDLLWRGDSLDQMSSMSSSLRDESMKYRKAARKINIDAMIRQYAPLAAVAFLFLFIIWIKFF